MRRLWIFAIAVGVTVATAYAAFALGLDRRELWQVVRACVADYQLTGAAFPCLEVDLSGGEERGHAVLRPPVLRELIVAPTREISGVEDPILQSPDAPNYFDAAWRARSFLKGADGRDPERDAIALAVNSARNRGQDQLHIHVGCLKPSARLMLAAVAPKIPLGKWVRIGAVVPHSAFWATRVEGTDLSQVEPFRLAAEGLADKVANRSEMMIVAAGDRVEGQDGFLILATYGNPPGAWWAMGSWNVMDSLCER
jgi:CDP-diacylglycerol pyrophosphatase